MQEFQVPVKFAEIKAKTQLRLERQKRQQRKTLDELKKEMVMSEHLLRVDELASKMPTSRINPAHPELSLGLNNSEYKEQFEIQGPNMLTPKSTTPIIWRFLKQFTNFFCILLEVAAVLCLIAFIINAATMQTAVDLDLGNLYLAIALVLVVVFTSVFTFYQEEKSSAIMRGFKKMVPEKTIVVRNGNMTSMDSSLLVPGDVVKLTAGNKIPADIRLIYQKEFMINNSSLTGESDLIPTTVDSTHNNPLESRNIVFFGTFAESGVAYGIVLFTGDDTMMGRIASLAQEAEGEMTPLHIQINHFTSLIFVFAIILGIIFITAGFLLYPKLYVSNIIFTIGIIVAIVPEGLLATVTLCLTLTAKRMALKSVLVKNLESVETLGSVTTIASDKTGTLTMNKMTVAHVWFDNTIFPCPMDSQGSFTFEVQDPTFDRLVHCATLCNNATFDPNNPTKTIGDASESALLQFVSKLHSVPELRSRYPKVSEIPFSSITKWQMSIHFMDHRVVLWVKGAPERVIQLCTKIMINGKSIDLTKDWKEQFSRTISTLGEYGERCLGFAMFEYDRKEFPPDFEFDVEKMELTKKPNQNMTFLGIFSMIDPPREGVTEAVAKCKSAGIRVIMVTGDHPTTAAAIARQVGIIESSSFTQDEIAEQFGIAHHSIPPERATCEIVHGNAIPHLSNHDWDKILEKKEIVFARTSPQQKLIIVEKCQERGEVVAVTGDGVNDSPALKKANIGIAMGSGTDVCKDASDMILLDDNFASIVNAIEEGRLIFDNLKKSIAFIISHTIPQLFPFIAFSMIGIPLPLGTLMVLSVDLLVDMIPAICFAYEYPEADLMKRGPRNQNENMVSGKMIAFSFFQIGVIETLSCFFSYFVVMSFYGFPPFTLPYMSLSPNNHFLPSNSNPIGNVNGQLFSHFNQAQVLRAAQTAYFISIVICQQANMNVCRTRLSSWIIQPTNWMLVLGRLISLVLAALIVYLPWVNVNIFQTEPISPLFWLPALPFAFFIILFGELKKLMVRLMRFSWIEKLTVW